MGGRAPEEEVVRKGSVAVSGRGASARLRVRLGGFGVEQEKVDRGSQDDGLVALRRCRGYVS